jgi:succinoglycan biosynthesis transport protein ExoP
MNQSVELKDILNIMKKNTRLIVITVIIFTLLGAIVSYLLPPVFQAKSDLLVNNSNLRPVNQEISTSEIDTNLMLIETYKYILKSPRVLELVSKDVDSSLTIEDMSKQINVETNAESQIISITAQERSYPKAAELVNSTAKVFQEEIQNLMKMDNVQILTEAKDDANASPIKPNHIIYTVLAFLFGVVTSLILLLLKETIFAKTDSVERAEKVFQLPSLGLIPEIAASNIGKNQELMMDQRYLKTLPKMDKHSPILEAYRVLRTNLQYAMNQQQLKTILFTSTNPEEGKSLTAGNLAICMAMDHKKTVYVDSDLRKGVGSTLFDMPARKGLSTYLEGYADLDEIIQSTEIPNLSFISKGPSLYHPAELMTSVMMDQLLEQLKERFDLVIIDCPPLIVTDAVALSTKVDGCIFVVHAKKTKQDHALKSIGQLRKVQANILGSVVNFGKLPFTGPYYY